MAALSPKIHFNVPLAPRSTFRIGGKSRFFVLVRKPEELCQVVQRAIQKREPFKIFAGGSNVVFPDEGLGCLVIQALGGKITVGRLQLIVDAGVLLGDVIKKAIALGFRGLETLSGIPGTIGGAVVGNAGAYGHSISEVIDAVEVWDPSRNKKFRSSQDQRLWLPKDRCGFRYRHSIFKEPQGKNYIILRIRLKFPRKDSPKTLREISKSIITLRLRKYKPGIRCPGSFFKNVLVSEVSKKSLALVDPTKIIEGKIPAGYLLEQVGAKGMRVGGIEVAHHHGNLFINRGRGTAKDVKKLAKILKDRVKKKFGIELEEEIRYF